MPDHGTAVGRREAAPARSAREQHQTPRDAEQLGVEELVVEVRDEQVGPGAPIAAERTAARTLAEGASSSPTSTEKRRTMS